MATIFQRALDKIGLGSGRPKKDAAYFTQKPGPLMFSWNPALRDVNVDVRTAWRPAAARSVEALQNSGWLAGAVDSVVAGTVGKGLKLNCTPDFMTLGWTPQVAAEWSKMVERRYSDWSQNPYLCDAAGRMTLGQMEGAWLRHWIAFGEAFAMFRVFPRPGSEQQTRPQLISALQVSQDNDDQQNMVQGVKLDNFGAPISYKMSFTAQGRTQDLMVPARDPDGRRLVVHAFNGEVGQVRGISPLAPVLKVIRQYDQLADATLITTLLQTIFAATIKSELPTEQAMQMLQSIDEAADFSLGSVLDARAGWYENTQIDLGGHGRIAHLFPNDEFNFHSAASPNDNYDTFHKGLLREIARCLGVTYEDLSGDYASATYSSVRMGTHLNWQVVRLRRENIVAPFSQAVYEAWLEEEILTNRIEFPGSPNLLTEFRDAVFSAEWRGPPQPTADDLKTAKAYRVLWDLGIMSREMICAEYGYDVLEVDDASAREAEYRDSLGLPPIPTEVGQPASSDQEEEETGSAQTSSSSTSSSGANNG